MLEYQDFILEDHIGDRFSKEVIQSYYQNNNQNKNSPSKWQK